MDTVFSTLHAQGVGAEKKSAPAISIEDEELLWEKGVLSFATPKTLQYAVFFYVGLHFSLRGGQEQLMTLFLIIVETLSLYHLFKINLDLL